MDENRFWTIIDKSRKEAAAPGKQHEALAEILQSLTAEEIAGFAKHWYTKHGEAYRWDLWAVAYIIHGGCSDDAFMDFRAWLIGQGRDVYESALADPASVGNLVESSEGEEMICYEELNYVSSDAYKKKTSQELPTLSTLGVPPHPSDPIGKSWDEEELPELYPELCKKFGC